MSYSISPLRLCRGERLSLSEIYQMLRSEINLLMHWSTYMAQYQYQKRQQTVVCVDCLFPCIGHHFLGNNNKDEGGVSSIWNEREARSRNNKLIVPILGSLLTCTNVHAILRPHPVSPRRYNCIKLERDEGEQAKQRVQQHQLRSWEGGFRGVAAGAKRGEKKRAAPKRRLAAVGTVAKRKRLFVPFLFYCKVDIRGERRRWENLVYVILALYSPRFLDGSLIPFTYFQLNCCSQLYAIWRCVLHTPRPTWGRENEDQLSVKLDRLLLGMLHTSITRLIEGYFPLPKYVRKLSDFHLIDRKSEQSKSPAETAHRLCLLFFSETCNGVYTST
jgi:hypothetical protein